VRSDFLLAIEDAHEAVGGDEPERLSHEVFALAKKRRFLETSPTQTGSRYRGTSAWASVSEGGPRVAPLRARRPGRVLTSPPAS
jgi:hypothetical protein